MPPPRGIILALDLGAKRIGMAVTDGLGITIQGLPTLIRKSPRADLNVLRTVIHKYGIEEVILGNPLNMSGEAGDRSAETQEFADRLRGRFGLPVHLVDERLTSWQAESELRESSKKVAKGDVDQRSAELILQAFLESHPPAGSRLNSPCPNHIKPK